MNKRKSNKSFMTLSKAECLQACQACLANSESKYNDAIALANNFSYGNASSQLIVSLEEMMKATILHFDANGFQFRRKVKGLGSIFQNHKLRYFLAFALSLLNVAGRDLKALLIAMRKNPNKFVDIKISDPRVQAKLQNWFLQKLTYFLEEITWLSKADLYRQEGFYVDCNDIIKSPLDVTEQQFVEFRNRIDNFRPFIIDLMRTFDLFDQSNPMKKEILSLQKTFISDGYYQKLTLLISKLNERDFDGFKVLLDGLGPMINNLQSGVSMFKSEDQRQ